MASQELMRNAKAPSAFDIPAKCDELRTPHSKRGGS